jgi:hypothetical protein
VGSCRRCCCLLSSSCCLIDLIVDDGGDGDGVSDGDVVGDLSDGSGSTSTSMVTNGCDEWL